MELGNWITYQTVLNFDRTNFEGGRAFIFQHWTSHWINYVPGKGL